MSEKDYYEILGVSRAATAAHIKQAYRDLVRKYHPDAAGDDASNLLFQRVTEAYNVLSNEESRAEYDRRNPHRGSSEDAFKAYRKQSSSEGLSGEERDKFSRSNFFTAKNSNTGFAGPAATRFRPFEEANDVDAFLKNTWSKIKSYVREAFSSSKPGNSVLQKRRNVDVAEFLRGERIFYFSIDALESIRGTQRSVAINQDKPDQVIAKVTIPPLVSEGETVELPYRVESTQQSGAIKARIRIDTHPFVERDGLDIILKVPITIAEAVRGGEFDVPGLNKQLRVSIPAQRGEIKKLRIRGQGIKDKGSNRCGDLYVAPYVVLPEQSDQTIEQAAEAMNSYYSGLIRRDLPKSLK